MKASRGVPRGFPLGSLKTVEKAVEDALELVGLVVAQADNIGLLN